MDGWNSLIRYFKNNFGDGFRQVRCERTADAQADLAFMPFVEMYCVSAESEFEELKTKKVYENNFLFEKISPLLFAYGTKWPP